RHRPEHHDAARSQRPAAASAGTRTADPRTDLIDGGQFVSSRTFNQGSSPRPGEEQHLLIRLRNVSMPTVKQLIRELAEYAKAKKGAQLEDRTRRPALRRAETHGSAD